MTASGNTPKVGYKQKMAVGNWQISGFLLFLKYEWILQGGEEVPIIYFLGIRIIHLK